MFISAKQNSFFLCPLLLILTFEVCIEINMMVKVNQATGKKHFLIEVEDGLIESTDAGNGAVGSQEEEDGDGRKSGQAS